MKGEEKEGMKMNDFTRAVLATVASVVWVLVLLIVVSWLSNA